MHISTYTYLLGPRLVLILYVSSDDHEISISLCCLYLSECDVFIWINGHFKPNGFEWYESWTNCHFVDRNFNSQSLPTSSMFLLVIMIRSTVQLLVRRKSLREYITISGETPYTYHLLTHLSIFPFILKVGYIYIFSSYV